MFLAAFISFVSFWMLLWHLTPQQRRRLVGRAGWLDLIAHGTVLWLFIGTSTEGLLQAEAAAIMWSLWLRGYRWAFGYERKIEGSWRRFAGRLTTA